MAKRLLNGLTIVVVGIILLMNTTGYLPWDVWTSALVYWPVLLIGLGVQIALSKWRVPGFSLAVIVMLILAAMNPYAGGRLWPWSWRVQLSPNVSDAAEKEWSVNLESEVSHLDLKLEAPAMEVTVAGLPELNDVEPIRALDATLRWDKDEPSTADLSSGDTLSATIKSSIPLDTPQSGKQEWTVSVNPSLTTKLNLSGGVATLNLDAGRLYVEDLVLSAGVVNMELNLGLSGKETDILVTGGVGNVTVTVPPAVGIRIDVGGGLMSRDFSRHGLVKSGGVWVTPDYDNATTKLNLTVNCGVGKVDLKRTDTSF